ncbi:hypothetical protein EDD37DRAFT_610993 [Exophiala viscosa]|uniref:uncharacterized protein n=1 Tax=Exophiala viscosa TaxID=2486360 RepID=UPI00219E9106|nr:hypothetical protein EDD37DRAFT_610993 [Exophiala viscosa]
MPLHTLDDFRDENGPFMHGAHNQAQDRPARNPFAERGRRPRNGARRARARSPSCDTCGYGGGGSDDDDREEHQELVLLLQDDEAEDTQYDLMHLVAWNGLGGEGRAGEPLMIMEIGGGDLHPTFEHVQDPAEAALAGPDRRGERQEMRGAGEDGLMFRRRRGGISGPTMRDGGEGEGQADPYGMGIGPASDWVDGQRRYAHGRSRDRGHGRDDYGRALELFRRALRYQG